ncbi:uncharacterized protein EI97DRAFT_413696 [Westerdykella ornata]|uniref:GDSL lipase/acylhydrolase family protein n=1 Tax=Westerdykella ornata TaxID=318751 RepID=A0A6A6JSH1_WESOR|nr:uncharacterized protein EI97DRAFT_413696 [Westerdykella ornata]KAF2278818.1 hypothetical protein EI97DRAFT_413696 [Westerdykella ornata]
MRCSSSSIVLLLNLAFALCDAERSRGWNLNNFKTLVTFGDSYTDENRLGYFINHNGSAPPVGWEQPGLNTASGGLSWPRYASLYSNATLYNYAVGGAVCSNSITPRFFSAINAPFPSITSYELPAFLADSKHRVPSTNKKFFTGTPRDTVYAIWIGTNDLGNNAFLTDSQVAGKTLKDYVDCVYSIIDTLHSQVSARYFVLLNLAPLNLLPQYATPENGGLPATKFFPEKQGQNITQISYRILESVATVNQIFAHKTPFETEVADRWDGDVKIANFDVNALMTDMYRNPKKYLNGTAEPNVTGVVNKCDVQGKNCVLAKSPDSFLWFDELHPSEQASRVVAREFVGVLKGGSKWAKYWG